jgi:segregation and condensation protein A
VPDPTVLDAADAADATPTPPADGVTPVDSGERGFSVSVGDFEGPFDLLLSLISKHKLEVTELALHEVTDEFIAYIRHQGAEWDLDEATEFLVVAATLLDLKAARLLPSGEVEDEEDLALLEARDLLFARLLQYRAYKEVASLFTERMATAARRLPRTVGLEPRFAQLLPEVLLGLGPEEFATLAARALAPKPVPQVSTTHVHAPRVSVREQAAILVDRLRRVGTATFRALVSDCDTTLLVVGRFLALLELYREGVVHLEQLAPLGDLTVRWTGTADGEVRVGDEYDGATTGSDAEAGPAPEPAPEPMPAADQEEES